MLSDQTQVRRQTDDCIDKKGCTMHWNRRDCRLTIATHWRLQCNCRDVQRCSTLSCHVSYCINEHRCEELVEAYFRMCVYRREWRLLTQDRDLHRSIFDGQFYTLILDSIVFCIETLKPYIYVGRYQYMFDQLRFHLLNSISITFLRGPSHGCSRYAL